MADEDIPLLLSHEISLDAAVALLILHSPPPPTIDEGVAMVDMEAFAAEAFEDPLLPGIDNED